MMKNDIIEPCRSEWFSHVLLVPKKTDNGNKKRGLVVDFRKQNHRLVNDNFLLLNFTDKLDLFSGAIYFSI